MTISHEQLEEFKRDMAEDVFPPAFRQHAIIADLERARELLRAFVKAYEESTPVTEYNVVEANAYCEAAAYLKDAGIE